MTPGPLSAEEQAVREMNAARTQRLEETIWELRETITALEAEREALREALREVLDVSTGSWSRPMHDEERLKCITRTATAALVTTQEGPP